MSKICSECGTPIIDEFAIACPKCGCPIELTALNQPIKKIEDFAPKTAAAQTVSSTANAAAQTVNNTANTTAQTINNTANTTAQTVNNTANAATQAVNNTANATAQTVSSTTNDIKIDSVQTNYKKKSGINVGAIIALVTGIAIIVLGVVVMRNNASVSTHSAPYYSAKSAEFGADFYTYMYNASDTMVDELNSINQGVEAVSKAPSAIITAIYYSVGMLIIAIGLCTVAVSLTKIQKQ